MFSEYLINWYTQNKRDLPWRNTTDVYKVWLSEIILQQTQVKQGLPYYNKFVQLFPTVNDLASAPIDEVLLAWQGLGYYSRARNLHSAAQFVSKEFNGVFPTSYKELLQLKGVGDYTASAIASFCYKEVTPVVDGNVLRVISRYFGVDEAIDLPKTVKSIKAICQEMIPKDAPDIFNQAIMEFGALQCTPKQTDCSVCPLQTSCWAYKYNKVTEIPFKSKKIKKRDRYFYYLLKENNGEVEIERRENTKDIWQGLYQFPLLELEQEGDVSDVLKQANISVVNHVSKQFKHVLSHQNIYATFIHFEGDFSRDKSIKKINLSSISNYAFPQLIQNYINKHLIER